MVKRVFVLISLVVAILVIVGNAFAQNETSNIPEPSLSSEWKSLGRNSKGTSFYINTRKITYLPGGIVKVWGFVVPRGEDRRRMVNILKNNLFSEGKDPNNAERLWYLISLYKINCKAHQWTEPEDIVFSFEKRVLDDISYQHEVWKDIVPGIIMWDIEKQVCKSKASIPEPSLGPEWKLVARDSVGTTLYLNTRRITHLPKGIVKVRTLLVPRGELRREDVNFLKKVLTSKGKDPNNAERLWYETFLYKFNCKTNQITVPEGAAYSFEKTVLFSYSFQHEKWNDIDPGSEKEGIENYVCKKYKRRR